MKPTLYKYLSVNREGDELRLEKLLTGWLYFSSPFHFNDPFELNPVVSLPSAEELNLFAQHSFNVEITESTQKKILRNVRRSIPVSPPKFTDEWLSSIGVTCLSEKNDSLLMWAHYADNHTGICIGFDSGSSPFDLARKVFYSNDRARVPAMPLHQDDEALVKNVILCKSAHWQYEEEWRIIKRPIRREELDYYAKVFKENPDTASEIANLLASEGGPGLYQFDPVAVRRIYLGARATPKTQQLIVDMLSKLNLKARLFQMQLDPRYFGLNPIKIKGDRVIACE